MKEKKFKFVGTGARDYNDSTSLDYVESICKEAGVKLVAAKNPVSGYMENVIVKEKAKPDKEGNYKQKDFIGRFGDAGRCVTFVSGMNAAIRLNKKKQVLN